MKKTAEVVLLKGAVKIVAWIRGIDLVDQALFDFIVVEACFLVLPLYIYLLGNGFHVSCQLVNRNLNDKFVELLLLAYFFLKKYFSLQKSG